MKYKKEVASLLVYIDNFDPAEFTSAPQDNFLLIPTPERLARAQKLKAKLVRNRQNAESFKELFANATDSPDVTITQAEVDALLEEWTSKNI